MSNMHPRAVSNGPQNLRLKVKGQDQNMTRCYAKMQLLGNNSNAYVSDKRLCQSTTPVKGVFHIFEALVPKEQVTTWYKYGTK